MKTAVVTGGGSGIGQAVAQRLRADGLHVAVIDLNPSDAEFAYTADVTDRTAIDDALTAIRAQLGPVTVLVNAAGLEKFKRFTDITFDDWQRVIDVNLNGVFHCVQAVLPDMIEAGWGRIVNISSSSAQTGSAKMAPYSASKHAIEGLSESLRRELMLFGIDVIIIAPGAVKTPIWAKADETDISVYKNSPYFPALERMRNFTRHFSEIGLPPEKIAERIADALTMASPKVRYQIAPDPMRHLITGLLPKRMVDKIIAKRLGLMPKA